MEPNVLYLYDYLDAAEAQRLGRLLASWYPPDAAEPRPLQVRIHSPGGEVFSGFAIYHQLLALRERGVPVETVVDGLAASMASVVAMAGAPVSIAANAQLMIHNPWTTAQGDGDDLRRTAEELDRLRAQLLEVYSQKSGQNTDALAPAMDAETYFDAPAALRLGLADRQVAQVLDGPAATSEQASTPPERLHVYQAYRPRASARAEQRVARLEAELQHLRDSLHGLQQQLASMPRAAVPTDSLSTRLRAPDPDRGAIAHDRRAWTMRDWERRDPAGLEQLRDTAPASYRRLYASTYHRHLPHDYAQ